MKFRSFYLSGAIATAIALTASLPASAESSTILIGDSLACGAGQFFKGKTFCKTSSGLIVKSFYDWPAKAQEILGKENPQIVAIWLGANDGQPMLENPVGSPIWRAAYKERWVKFLNVFKGRSVVVFLGAPSTRLPYLNAINEVIAEAALETNAAIAQISHEIERSKDGVHYLNYRAVSQEIDAIVEAMDSSELDDLQSF